MSVGRSCKVGWLLLRGRTLILYLVKITKLTEAKIHRWEGKRQQSALEGGLFCHTGHNRDLFFYYFNKFCFMLAFLLQKGTVMGNGFCLETRHCSGYPFHLLVLFSINIAVSKALRLLKFLSSSPPFSLTNVWQGCNCLKAQWWRKQRAKPSDVPQWFRSLPPRLVKKVTGGLP